MTVSPGTKFAVLRTAGDLDTRRNAADGATAAGFHGPVSVRRRRGAVINLRVEITAFSPQPNGTVKQPQVEIQPPGDDDLATSSVADAPDTVTAAAKPVRLSPALLDPRGQFADDRATQAQVQRGEGRTQMGSILIDQLATISQVGTDYRSYSLSPNGAQLAFQWHRDGNWQIYLMPADGSAPPRRLVEIDDSLSCPLFSRDERYLYFARDDRGSECHDIYRYELATGTTENLLPDTPDFSPLPDFDLSPDGSRVALSAFNGTSYHLALMPAIAEPGGEHVTFVTDHDFNDLSPTWSPDGRRLAFTSETRGQDTAVGVYDVDQGTLCWVGGGDDFIAAQPTWSPDGRTLVFSGGPFDHPAIGLCDIATGNVSWVWQCDLDCHHPVWSPNGHSIAFLSDEDATTSLWWLNLGTQELRCLDVGPGNHYQPGFTPDGLAVIAALSGPGNPPELFLIEIGDGKVTQLTHSGDAAFAKLKFISGRPLTFLSRDHLAEVPGLLAQPREPNGAAVIIVHGGPTWHHSNEWDPLRQAFLAAGLTVLHPNYRGSDGYGRRWQLANRYLMGQGEVLDCAAGHDALVALGCDPTRIAVTGRSWGGYMTMALLTQFPELFACGVAGVPFFDFIDAQVDPRVRGDLSWWDRENTGDIETDRAKLEYYSPINHLDRVRAPLLLLAAALDPRCPPSQIDTVCQTLRARGQECESVIYPDEGHAISGMAHRLDYDRRTVAFILRHLGVDAAEIA
jgi:dipeptidyl aminopeptidase/acylaminoacyl peptidase